MKARTSLLSAERSWVAPMLSVGVLAALPLVGCSLDDSGTMGANATSTTSSAGGGTSSSSGTAGGMGGQAGMGGMGGSGGTGGSAPVVIEQWVAGTETINANGTYTLPSWLQLVSTSPNKTVQTGPATLKTGFVANDARARNVTGNAADWGLSVESERTNRVHYARITMGNWTFANGATYAMATGPDGTDAAATINDTSAAVNSSAYRGMNAEAVGTASTISVWMADTMPVTPVSSQAFFGASVLTGQGIAIGPQVGWGRFSYTNTENGNMPANAQLYPSYGMSPGMGSAIFDFVQVETGRYPSSVIISMGAATTRDRERLYAVNNPPTLDLAPNGYFHIVLVFAPNYAKGEQAMDHDLINFDGGASRIYLRASDGAVVMAVGNPTLSATLPNWQRDEPLMIEAKSESNGRRLTVTGGASDSHSSSFTLPATSSIYILGDSTGSQECADLRAITFYEPMQ